MNYHQPVKIIYPDEETLQAWENMRIEILHELQEGASADVPDNILDDIGNLIVVLASWRPEKRPLHF